MSGFLGADQQEIPGKLSEEEEAGGVDSRSLQLPDQPPPLRSPRSSWLWCGGLSVSGRLRRCPGVALQRCALGMQGSSLQRVGVILVPT